MSLSDADIAFGLPAGMMPVARHFDEVAIYRAASAFEKASDRQGVRP